MRKIIILFVLMFCLLPLTASADFSRGVRFGVITKASVSGYIKKSLECDMLIGVDSMPYQVVSRSTDSKGRTSESVRTVNPWKFSGDVTFKDVVDEVAGELVYVEYNQEYINTGMVYNTDYRILDIGRILDPFPGKDAFDSDFGKAGKSDGFRIGYIVKASQKGLLVDSWEVTIQEGSGGNKFIDMSVTDKALYDFIYKCVKTGAKVKILYKDLGVLNILDPLKDTRYRVIGVIKL